VLLVVLAELLLCGNSRISGVDAGPHPLAFVVPLDGAAPVDLACESRVQKLLLHLQHGAAVVKFAHWLLGRLLDILQDVAGDWRGGELHPAPSNRRDLHSACDPQLAVLRWHVLQALV